MGLFNSKPATSTPTVSTILPEAAKTEILSGRLPQLNTDRIFLQKGEKCHYIDKTIMMKPKVRRSGTGFSAGVTIWGVRISRGFLVPEEETYFERVNGIIYITNKRTIFEANSNGFSKTNRSLTAVTSYTNAVDMQFGSSHYCMVVPNGVIVEEVYNILLKGK